jgi:hypothetical protein
MTNSASFFAVYCDGGLCNRLNSLVVAMILAQDLKKVLVVYWPINTWCGLDYYSIFEKQEDIIAYDISMLDLNLTHSHNFSLFAHEQQLFSSSIIANPNLIRKYEDLYIKIFNTLEYKSVLYYNSIIPYCISLDRASLVAKNLPFLAIYRVLAYEYIATHRLASDSPWAIHLRGTDFGFSKAYYNFWYLISKFFPSKLLLMTDDIFLKTRFAKLSNVCTRIFHEYPSKLNPDFNWNEEIVDSYGRKFNFNIQRTGASVKESVTDLLILSQSKLLINSNSTYLVFAMLIRGYKFSLVSYCYFNFRRLRQLIRILRKTKFNSQFYFNA